MKKDSLFTDQSGGVLVLIALLLVVLLGVAAFAIDIGHLTVVRNEIRNAADAGSLAGARKLYSSLTGSQITVNTAANTVASDATSANASDGAAAEVISVERGHWCFSCMQPDGVTPGVFTANSSGSFNLSSFDFAAIDTDVDYINAVRVVAGRGPTVQAASFFAGIFGFSGFTLNTESVAWVGFAGSNIQVDQPIAICRESLLDNDGNFT